MNIFENIFLSLFNCSLLIFCFLCFYLVSRNQEKICSRYIMEDYPDFKLHDKIIPLPNIDKDDFHEKWYEGRNLADLIHPFKIVCCSPPNAGKTTAIMNIFMRCQLGRKAFETLIVIQPETSHEYDQLDPTLIITDIPAPEDIVLSKEDMKKTAIIIDDFEMSRLNKVQIANLSKLFRYLSSHNNISIFLWVSRFSFCPHYRKEVCDSFLNLEDKE